MYHYTDGGLGNVWLANGFEIKKTPYGEGVAFHNLDGLTRSICMALTRKASCSQDPLSLSSVTMTFDITLTDHELRTCRRSKLRGMHGLLCQSQNRN